MKQQGNAKTSNVNTDMEGKKEMEEKLGKQTLDDILQEKKRELQLEQAFELSNSASFTDCTGSVPAAPVTEEQWNNYDESYHFQPKPANPQEKRKIFR